MVLPAIIMYFGTKLVQRTLESRETQDAQAPQDRWLYERSVRNEQTPPPSAPPMEITQTNVANGGMIKHISGLLKDNYFYHDSKVLNLKNITILHICVCPLSETTDKTYSGKVSIMSEKGSIFKQEYNERVRWITLPGSGLYVTNATIKIKVKTGQAVVLQYSVVFSEA